MFKKLKELASKGQLPPVDPASFGDPLAELVEWTPANPGGANFRTHRLVPVSDRRLEFRSTLGARLFCWVFIGIGLVAPVAVWFVEKLEFNSWWASAPFWFATLVSVIFLLAGTFLLRELTSPVSFDLDAGEFFRKHRLFRRDRELRKHSLPLALDRVHALQLLREHVHDSDSSYYSYELNLVLEDAQRILVVDHGKRDELVADAEILAAFLGVPLWDGSAGAQKRSASRTGNR